MFIDENNRKSEEQPRWPAWLVGALLFLVVVLLVAVLLLLNQPRAA